jgi:DNA-binding transcriptional regulator YdaS (Cro superfamily)
MRLGEYLSENAITQSAFAATIGVSAATVGRYVSGDIPSAKIMIRIHKATKGAVSFDDLLGMPRQEGE